MENRTTPGVYITELSAFPTSVVGVPTSIPVFIGYSERRPLPEPILIESLADYRTQFGEGCHRTFRIAPAIAGGDFSAPGSVAASYDLIPSVPGNFNLYDAAQLFFANGGGSCYVASCGDYSATAIDLAALQAGLAASGTQTGPTMVVMPDACQLGLDDYRTLAAATLAQCAALQDRVAILDLPGSTDPANWSVPATTALAEQFYQAMTGSDGSYSYGTAYHPALRTTLYDTSAVDYTNIDLADPQTATILAGLLKAEATDAQAAALVARLLSQGGPAPSDPTAVQQFNQALVAALSLIGRIEAAILARLNVAPASGAIAGIWAQTDQNRGVWNAPANVGLASVLAPAVELSDADQGPLNAPLNGFAINLVRSFVSRGTVVWGARTLDGNSNDYRYVPVRRTVVYVEQSIKAALAQYAFAPNDGQTWATVTAAIGNFLTGLWTEGGLMGDKASEAFSVRCGLGSTMTGQDILDGYMLLSVALQMVHPAEFIELTFTQKMQGT